MTFYSFKYMTKEEREKLICDYDEDLDDCPDDVEYNKILNKVANYIGWIIIGLNSLEDTTSFNIREFLGSGDGHDEQHYIFLSEMTYNAKVNTLIKLYAFYINGVFEEAKKRETIKHLDNLECLLKKSGKIRNRYAHADWESISKKHFVKVRTKAKKSGVFHIYRKFNITDMKKDVELIEKAQQSLENFDETYINFY